MQNIIGEKNPKEEVGHLHRKRLILNCISSGQEALENMGAIKRIERYQIKQSKTEIDFN